MNEHQHHRYNDEITFEVITNEIRNQKKECNDSIAKQFEQWGKQYISWTVATYFFVGAVTVVAGATWIIRDSIDRVKDAIPITTDVVRKVNFTADKIAILEKAVVSKTDSINKDAVEKAVKILKVEQQK
jgi:hypothetical protein